MPIRRALFQDHWIFVENIFSSLSFVYLCLLLSLFPPLCDVYSLLKYASFLLWKHIVFLSQSLLLRESYIYMLRIETLCYTVCSH